MTDLLCIAKISWIVCPIFDPLDALFIDILKNTQHSLNKMS